MIVNDIGLTKDSYSNIYTADGSEIGTIYDREGHVIYYMYRDTIGDSSRVFTSYGTPIKDYKIYGETIQNGTPSPDMPVDVVGCGVRTENLFDGSKVEQNCYYDQNGTKIKSSYHSESDYIPVEAGKTYTLYLKRISVGFGTFVNLYDTSLAFYKNVYTLSNAGGYYEFTPDVDGYIRFNETPSRATDYMLYEGSRGKSYDPYGYKLPETITNGTDTVTTPIYIGSEPIHRLGNYADYSHYSINKIVRRINKMVLTGQETGIVTGSSKTFFMPVTPAARRTRFMITVLSNKYKAIGNTWDFGIYNASDNIICFAANSPDPGPTPGYSLAINDSRFGGSVSSFRSYLAEQYAAGTPVTIWYVLYEPIEEDPPVPLPELPTLVGTNTLSIDTPVKPSEIDLTGRLKTSGYGQLLDKNLTAINDSTGTPIFIRG